MSFQRKLIFVTAIWLIAFTPALVAQQHDTIPTGKPGWYTGFTAGIGQSAVLPEGTSTIAKTVAENGNLRVGSADVGYYFSQYAGISSGLRFSSNSGNASLAAYANHFNTTDSEKEPYERRITGGNIKEKQTIAMLEIPLLLHLRVPLGARMGMFLQTGINLAFPVVKKYESTGTFTYKGYYPSYNVILENLPDYGFPTNAAVSTKSSPELKPLVMSGAIAAGFDFKIQPKIRLSLAVSYDKSLSTISAATNPESFQLSPDATAINSLLGGSSQTLLQAFGVQCSIHYFLHP